MFAALQSSLKIASVAFTLPFAGSPGAAADPVRDGVEPESTPEPAPMVGFAYAMQLPFIGVAVLATLAYQAMVRNGHRFAGARSTAMVVAAPLAGLAYVVLMPFIGLGALGWLGFRALVDRVTATPGAGFALVRKA